MLQVQKTFVLYEEPSPRKSTPVSPFLESYTFQGGAERTARPKFFVLEKGTQAQQGHIANSK